MYDARGLVEYRPLRRGFAGFLIVTAESVEGRFGGETEDLALFLYAEREGAFVCPCKISGAGGNYLIDYRYLPVTKIRIIELYDFISAFRHSFFQLIVLWK